MTWCDCIMKMEPTSILLHETKLFVDGLNQVGKLFSSLLFWFISLMMVEIILLSFISITQLMDADNGMEWERKFIFIYNGLMALGLLYWIISVSTTSEMLAVYVRQLEDLIMNVQLKANEVQQQNMVCNFLSKFSGFDANGYFTLNHSMLTGMIANIVTYLVILVQFRQSGV